MDDHAVGTASSLASVERERHALNQIARGVPLEQALEDLLRVVEAQSFNRMRASILIVGEDGRHLRHGAAPSLPSAYNEAIDGILIGEGVGSCGTVAHRGTPVYANDIATDANWADFRDLALSHGLRACWSTPIRGIDGTTLGTFAIYYDAPRAPIQADIEAITFVTQTTALVIERHLADQQLRRSRDELRKLDLRREQAEAALHESEAYWRDLFERLDEGFMVVEVVRDDAGVARTWRFVEINAAWERMSGLSVATARGRNVEDIIPGIEPEWIDTYIRVAETGEAAAFKMPVRALGHVYDVRAFRVAPDRVGVLFQEVSAQQIDETRRAALLELNDALAKHDDIVRLSDVACEILGRTLDVQLVGYGVVDPEAETITIERDWSTGGVEPRAGILNFRDFGFYIDDLKRGEMVVVADARTDPRTRNFAAALEARGARAFVNTPVFERGRFVALQYAITNLPRDWSEGELRFFLEVAGRTRTATARRQAENDLRILNASLEQQVTDRTLERDRAWNLARELLVIARPDGALEAVNPFWTVLLGWTETDLLGRSFVDLTHPDDLAATVAVFEGIFSEPLTTSYEYRLRHKDGSYRWVGWTGSFEAGRVYASGRNLTAERKQAETLRQSERRASTFFNFSDDYLFLVQFDADGIAHFGDMNPACERVMGIVQAEVVGRPVRQVLPANSAADIDKYGRLCLAKRQPQTYKAVREHEAGKKVIINGRVAFVERFDEGGGLVLFSGNDVTEQHRTEEALRQAQKMEAVGQLTGGLAHDFNNLLAGISGALELMQTRMGQGRFGELDRYMNVAQGAARRAASLTHRLLAFSRRQTLDPKPTNVNRLIAGMEDLIRRTTGPQIALEVVGAAGLWPALIDPGQLENALLNLCINARDAMPGGGRITIETANKWLDRPAAVTHAIPEGQYLSVCVTDTGTGMSADLISKVFEPFFTTKPIGEGTGLGLSMIHGFAHQSGGQVRIYSEVGEGTTVCLYLPRHYGSADADDAMPKLADAARADQGETVLIVDDEPSVRMLVTEVLEDLGYTAIEAADSLAGLKVLQSDVRIDLLVTDVGLPGGMNGRQMADAGRERRPDLKVLFITGYAENAVLGNGHLKPGMQVLTKPFPMDALAVRIKELIVVT